MALRGTPLRLQVCNRAGECTFVKTERPLVLEGAVVQIATEEVSDVIEAISNADDELNADNTPWPDNFDLKKVRERSRQQE